MSNVMDMDKNDGIPRFEHNWEKWKRAVELYILSKNITDDVQKQAVLLHKGGMQLQDIFFSLPEYGKVPENTTRFIHTTNLLDNYFILKVNKVFERYTFRQMKQLNNENVNQYISRLRQQAAKCKFAELDKEIRDQVIAYCSSSELRKRLLEKGEISLSEVSKIAETWEVVTKQSELLCSEKETTIKENINQVWKKNKNSLQKKVHKTGKTQKGACYRCGSTEHFKNNLDCPAKDKKCARCDHIGHFKAQCKTKLKTRKSLNKNVNHIEEENSQDGVVFQVTNCTAQDDKIQCKVGGVSTLFIVDSGSSCNIISEKLWSEKDIKFLSNEKNVSQKLFGYASEKPSNVVSKIRTTIEVGNRETITDIFIVQGGNSALLGRDTAMKLGVLKIGLNVNEISASSTEQKGDKYKIIFPELFMGIGKLKGTQIHLHIDKTVQPIAHQHRRVPIHLREQVENELERLEKLDIIEKVSGPTPWVSPIVLVPKKNGDLRLCVDMRRPNTAIKRVRHITPTIDDILSAVNGSTVFTKLDLNEGYHQLELDNQSRYITTFSTHVGLRRYKRLSFGINSAAEIFQDTIRQVLVNIPNVLNVSDDILIFAKTQKEHDTILRQVLERLQESRLTLKFEKCLFSVSTLTFFGYQFDKNRMKPDNKKIKDFIELQSPTNQSEVRSVLGMIMYCGRFIPDLATKTKPLRDLTRVNQKWKWGKVEQEAFENLKKLITNNITNSFYDTRKQTELIVDASPDGVAAILAQPDHQENHIIACASRAFNEVEKRYAQIEREMLAVVWGIQHFKLYLMGTKFVVRTDNQPLVTILTSKTKETSTRLENLRLKIQGYMFEVVYTKGRNNPSDFMSRHPLQQSSKTMNKISKSVEESINAVTQINLPRTLSRQEVAEHTANDEELTKVIKALQNNLDMYPKYNNIRNELAVTGDGVILKLNKIVIPMSLREKVIRLAHTGHQGIEKTKTLLRSKVWFPS